MSGKVDYIIDIFQKESKKLLKNTNNNSNKDNNIVRSLTYTTTPANNNNSDTFSGSTIKVVAHKAHMHRMFRMLSFPESDVTPTTGMYIYHMHYIYVYMYMIYTVV